jgi:hypothetical protein
VSNHSAEHVEERASIPKEVRQNLPVGRRPSDHTVLKRFEHRKQDGRATKAGMDCGSSVGYASGSAKPAWEVVWEPSGPSLCLSLSEAVRDVLMWFTDPLSRAHGGPAASLRFRLIGWIRQSRTIPVGLRLPHFLSPSPGPKDSFRAPAPLSSAISTLQPPDCSISYRVDDNSTF